MVRKINVYVTFFAVVPLTCSMYQLHSPFCWVNLKPIRLNRCGSTFESKLNTCSVYYYAPGPCLSFSTFRLPIQRIQRLLDKRTRVVQVYHIRMNHSPSLLPYMHSSNSRGLVHFIVILLRLLLFDLIENDSTDHRKWPINFKTMSSFSFK